MPVTDEQINKVLDDAFDKKLDEIILGYETSMAKKGVQLSNADRVGPDAKKKLSGLLKFYAKKAHPFDSCVADNRKRFGPKAEGVCAVLKDIIRGTTKWRGKNNPRDVGTPGVKGLSEDELIDDQIYGLCYHLQQLGTEGELQLEELLGYVTLTDYNSAQLDYPMQAPGPRPLSDSDLKFLKDLHGHHAKKLKAATPYATNADAHPDVVSFASDAVSTSVREMARISRMLKTGSPYG